MGDEHLADDALARYATDVASDDERSSVERHARACASCQARLDALLDSAFSSSRTQESAAPPPRAAVPPLTPGAKLARYVILERVGAGGMGEVFGAYDPELDRRVALKVLLPSRDEEAARTRLLREAQALARLQHPQVVAVHDVGVADGRVFIAMEFVRGQSLRAWLSTERSWQDIVTVFRSAGEGLAAAHAAGLVHRDFKPDNVIVGDDGRVRVVDFGLASQAQDGPNASRDGAFEVPSIDALSRTVTAPDATPGTLAYMAPEHLLGPGATAASDQFSFCVSLFEALSGERPFAARTLSELIAAYQRGPGRPPKRGPAWLHGAILRGLHADPGRRWKDMGELLRAMQGPRSRRIPAVAAGAVLVAALVASAVLIPARQREAACLSASGAAAAEWQGAHDEISRRFAATGLAYAAEALARIEAASENWSTAWSTARQVSCAAPPDARQTMQQCLDERLDEFRALLGVLRTADAEVVASATSNLRALEPPANCLDPALAPSLLSASVKRAERKVLQEAHALASSGRLQDAETQLRQLLASQPTTRARAEAVRELASLKIEAGAAESEVVTLLNEAVTTALAGHAMDLAAEALSQRAVSASQLHEPAKEWLALARAAAAAVGDDPALASTLEYDEATCLLAEGRDSEAVAALGRYKERLIARYGHDHPSVATADVNLAVGLQRLGRRAEALDLLASVVERGRRVDGALHPATALAIHNLSVSLRASGRYDEALRMAEEAVALRTRLFGQTRPTLASRSSMVQTLIAMHRDERALDELERLIADNARAGAPLKEAHLYEQKAELLAQTRPVAAREALNEALARLTEDQRGNSQEAKILLSLAELQVGQRDWRSAEATLGRARAILERVGRPLERALLASSYGNYEERRGRLPRALEWYAKARAQRVDAGNASPTTLADDLQNEGRVLRLLGRSREAVPLLAKAVDLRLPFQDAAALASSRFELARAMLAAGDRSRGEELLRLVLDDLPGDDAKEARALLRGPARLGARGP